MATDYATPVVSRIGTIALIAIVLMGSDRKGLEAAVPRSLPSTRIIVTTTSELQAALSPGNEGKQIVVRAGEYEISQPLAVPNRATLAGEGVMTFDESGLPIGFEPSRRTVLRSAPGLVGDILTLGDGATLRGLVIEDIAGRQGNPVVASSRAAGDFVSAQITECEIVNPNPSGITPQGPTGRGLVVMTRNPNLGFDPPPHEGAVLWVRMTRSIVRSPAAGIGVFAINFASHTEINLFLEGNVIGGGLNLSGGVSRPDAVTEAALSIESRRNLYRSDSVVPTPTGWSLIGGTTAPVPSLASGASTFNSLQIHSIDDEIKGFARGIYAPGGLRSAALPGPSSSNRVEMNLHGTMLETTTTDLALFGAQSLVDDVSPGDGNTVHLVMRKASGSGHRANQYADSWTPSMGNLGVANRIEIVGNAQAFERSNEGIDPIPPAAFFAAER